jgi:formylmethanofuran dehydrogenase subunit B
MVQTALCGAVCDDASIKPAQVSIEGLARLCNDCKAQQAGRVNFVLTTYCYDLLCS